MGLWLEGGDGFTSIKGTCVPLEGDISISNQWATVRVEVRFLGYQIDVCSVLDSRT